LFLSDENARPRLAPSSQKLCHTLGVRQTISQPSPSWQSAAPFGRLPWLLCHSPLYSRSVGLYLDSDNIDKIATLSHGIFWLFLPSLVLFIVLPLLLRGGLGFWFSLGVACFLTAAAYSGLVKILGILGVRL